ncbi:hypothetical protein HAX39_23490 [Citrobacter freundii]|nr:hypothetical protein [Citrobacter freundii]
MNLLPLPANDYAFIFYDMYTTAAQHDSDEKQNATITSVAPLTDEPEQRASVVAGTGHNRQVAASLLFIDIRLPVYIVMTIMLVIQAATGPGRTNSRGLLTHWHNKQTDVGSFTIRPVQTKNAVAQSHNGTFSLLLPLIPYCQ